MQQLSAYQKCLECVNGRFERVEYLVELAEWLVAQRASKGDARNALEGAVDLLLEVEGLDGELECAALQHLEHAQGLIDLVKAFETIPHFVLAAAACALGYPVALLRLSLAAYRLRRSVGVSGVFSR